MTLVDLASPLKLSRYLVVTQAPGREPGAAPDRILFGTRRASAVVIDKGEWERLAAEDYDALPVPVRQRLVDAEILVSADEDELLAVLDANRRALAANDVCYMIVQPSAFCQLDCPYCGQEHEPRNMDAEKAELLLRRVERKLAKGDFGRLSIGWFGGEPLLGLKVMRQLTPRLRALAAAANCTYSAKIVTNGVRLTPDVATILSEELGIEYAEITLDGLADQHDVRRPWKNGRGSFDTVFGNVIAAAGRDDLSLRVGIRCNVDRFNFQDVVPLMDRLTEAGVHHRIARFYVAPIHSWGNRADERSLSAEEFGRWEINWFAALARRGFPLSILPERCETVCLAVQPEAEVIDAAGAIFHCTEVSQVPAYTRRESGRGNTHAVGSLDDASAGAESPLRAFNDTIERGEVPCGKCELLPVCGGSCPKLWLEQKVACPPMKANLADRLRLVHLLESYGAVSDACPGAESLC